MELREIESIKITNSPCGNCYGNTESLELNELGEINHNYYNYSGNKVVKNIDYKVSEHDMKRLFKYALNHVEVDKWESCYNDEVTNGHKWEFEVRYSDNNTSKILGNAGVPPKANKLIQGILSLTNFEADPWIF